LQPFYINASFQKILYFLFFFLFFCKKREKRKETKEKREKNFNKLELKIYIKTKNTSLLKFFLSLFFFASFFFSLSFLQKREREKERRNLH